MSAVENDEHIESTHTIETDDPVVADTTVYHAKDTIPSAATSEAMHSPEEHVTTSHFTETAANELSSADTRGEVTFDEFKEEGSYTQEHAIVTEHITETHTTSATNYEDHTNTTTHHIIDDSQRVLGAEETLHLSDNMDDFEARLDARGGSHYEKAVASSDEASDAVNISALHGVETLIGDTNGEPIMLTENALETCVADPEVLAHSSTTANGLLMLNENALEVCEAEPTVAPTPKITAEELVEHEEVAVPVVEEAAVVEEFHAEEAAPTHISEVTVDDHATEETHAVSEELAAVVEQHAYTVTEETEPVHGSVEPAAELTVEEVEKHESVEEAVTNHDEEVVTGHSEEHVVVLENGNALHAESKDELSSEAVDEIKPAAAEVPEPVHEQEEGEITAFEATDFPSFQGKENDTVNAHVVSEESEQLVLLTSSSETCLADPQMDGEFQLQNGDATSFSQNGRAEENPFDDPPEEIVSEDVTIAVESTEAENNHEIDASTEAGQEVSTTSHQDEEIETVVVAAAEPVIEEPLHSEEAVVVSTEVEEVKVAVESQETHEDAVVESPETHEEVAVEQVSVAGGAAEIAESAASLDTNEHVTVASEVVASEVEATMDTSEVDAKEEVVEESAEAEVAVDTQSHEDVEVHVEATAVSEEASMPESQTTELTMLAHEDSAVCESEESSSASHAIPEAQVVEQPAVVEETDVVEQSVEVEETTVEEKAVAEEDIKVIEEPVVKEDTQILEEPAETQQAEEQLTVTEGTVAEEEIKVVEQPTVKVETEILEQLAETAQTQAEEQVTVTEETKSFEQSAVSEETSAPAIAITSETEEELVVSTEATTEPQEHEGEAARPKSPWTPSYTVTTQGPGTETEVADDAAELATLEKLPPAEVQQSSENVESESVFASTETTTQVTSTTEGPTRTWSLSYSVSEQGVSPLQAAQATEDTEIEPIEPLSTQAHVQEEAAQQESVPEVPPSFEVPEVKVEEIVEPPTIITTDETEVVVTETEAHAEDEAAEERAPERPWTPSYSVSRQGSEIQEEVETEVVAAEVVTQQVTEATEQSADATIVDESPKPSDHPARPWTPSYTVDHIGASPSLATKELDVSSQEQVETSPEVVVSTEEAIRSVTETEPQSQQSELATTESQAVPERPWTPSYSVEQQGSSPSLPSKEIEEQAVQSTAVEVSEEPAPARPWTPSYSVAQQGNSPSLPSKELEEPTVQSPVDPPATTVIETTTVTEAATVIEATSAIEASEEPAPARPWTPSYSVAQQGSSPSLPPKELEETIVSQPLVDEPTSAAIEVSEETTPARPWTPSYNVSRQGSTGPVTPSQAHETTPSVVQHSEQSSTTLSVEEREAAPERPWTPSYSVANQGSSPIIITKDVEVNSSVVVASEETGVREESVPPRPWTPSYSVERQGSSPQLAPVESAVTETVEAPARPWTPSYSVARQGSSPLLQSQDLPQVDSAPAPVQPEPVALISTPRILIDQLETAAITETAAVSSEEKPANWVPSYTVSQQGSPVASPISKPKDLSASELVVETTEETVVETTETTEKAQPERRWTASYSVQTQGPSSATESSLHAFPTTEVADNAPKPSLARLAPVDELEQSTVTTGGLDAAPPTTQRTRHESTASSRFFPGGWFSGSPKSPNDNPSPGQDVPVNTPVDGEPARRRWCLIM